MIADFLTARISASKEVKVAIQDIVIYYVGHGGFFDPGDQYFLALRDTRSNNEAISGYPIRALADTLKEKASQLRRYLILDCCFAGSAGTAFQSAKLETAKVQVLDRLPGKGTALLCAAGPKQPAKAPPDLKHTMFSEMLLQALRNGSMELPDRLSLAQIGVQIQDLIRERFKDAAVRPVMISPDQSLGDVAVLPLFPNLGMGTRTLLEAVRRTQANYEHV